jgi:hypothetical protein
MGCGCGGSKLSIPAQPSVSRSASLPGFQSQAQQQSTNVVRSQGLNLNQQAVGTQPPRVSMTRPTV